MDEDSIPILTLNSPHASARSDGRIAIVVETAEQTPFALEITRRSLTLLRTELIRAEMLLQRGEPRS